MVLPAMCSYPAGALLGAKGAERRPRMQVSQSDTFTWLVKGFENPKSRARNIQRSLCASILIRKAARPGIQRPET